MADISYLVEEKLPNNYRAMAVSIKEDFALITIVLDNDVHLEISLDELKFIARGFTTLPDWVAEADEVAGPTRNTNGKPIVKSTIKTETAAPAAATTIDEPKAPRHGARWNEEDDQKLLRAFCDAEQHVVEIARTFGRSPSSIVSRLLLLDAIEVIPKR